MSHLKDIQAEGGMVYRPTYLKMWWYADNTDPEVEEYETLEEAVSLIDREGANTPDPYFAPYNEVRVMYKEVWLDGDVVEEGRLLYPSELYDAIEAVSLKDDEITLKTFHFASYVEIYDAFVFSLYNAVERYFEEYNVYEYSLQIGRVSKYSTIEVYKDGEKIDNIQLRIADHSHNPANIDVENFVSVVIADTDPTQGKYVTGYNLHYTINDDIDTIIEGIADEVDRIIDNF